MLKWGDFLNKRDDEVKSEHCGAKDNEATGVPFDKNYRADDDYKKIMDLLKGKGNVPSPVKPPEEAEAGWFVVDEQTSGVWNAGGWSTDEAVLSEAIIDDIDKAKSVAQVVHGVVIPAKDILG